MTAFWTSLSSVEQTVIVAVALLSTGIALAASLPTIAECATHLIETLICLLLCIVFAASPATERSIHELMARLRKQRLQLQKMHRRTKHHPAREGAAA